MTVTVSTDSLAALVELPDSANVHIATATLIVTEQLSNAGLSEARLNLIATYLAAHFITLSNSPGGALIHTEVEGTVDKFANPGKGYEATIFGQQALALDTSTTLANNSANKGTAVFRVT